MDSSKLLLVAAALFIFMNTVFFVACFKKDNSIVDIAWGLGFILASLLAIFQKGTFSFVEIIATILVMLWGLRLATYILWRKKGKGEDFRYKSWRDTWKHFYLRSYFQIYMLQGTLLFLICLPILLLDGTGESGFGIWHWIGLGIWLLGFFCEVVADAQMLRFKRNPENKGKILMSGIWKYSRHPNYFGEVTLWWGMYLLCFQPETAFITLISPVLITLLILFVSGIPMLEAKWKGNAEFKVYKKRTRAFVPWWPKK